MAEHTFFVPEVVQTSAMDCGPAALKSILEGFGASVSYGRLREACQTDVDGTSIDTLEELAMQLGLDAEQVLLPKNQLLYPEAGAFPALAVTLQPTGTAHFVVVWRRLGPFVQIMDPATGRRWVTVRSLLSQLYVHGAEVPADAWRDYASGDEWRACVERGMERLGVSSASCARALRAALDDPTYRGPAALDAAVRVVESLVESGGLSRGRQSATLFETLFTRAREEDEVIPARYWSVTPADDDEATLTLRGALLVRMRGLRPVAVGAGPTGDTGDAAAELSDELMAALHEEPERPAARLWSILREDGLMAPVAIALALVAGAFGVLLEGLLFRGFIEVGDLVAAPERRIVVAAALLSFVLVVLALQIPSNAATFRLGRHLEGRLRIAFLSKIPRLRDRYFHSRLTSDMAQRAHAVHVLSDLPRLGASFLRASFALVATTLGVIWLDPGSWGWVLSVAAVSVGLPLFAQPLLAERDLRVQTHLGALSRFYLDALLGLAPLRTHGAAPALRREHEGLLVEWERASDALLRVSVSIDFVMAISGVLLTALLLFQYVWHGRPVSGALLLVYWSLAIPLLGQEVARAARQYPHLRNVALRLVEPLGAPEDPTEHDEELAPRSSGPVDLRFDGVTVRAGGHVILDGVDLHVEPGTKVAVVGPSGAGKSTLVGLLLGWHRPSEGRVCVDGEQLDDAGLARLRTETAWVDPAVRLWNRSLLENLRYGRDDALTSMSEVLHDAELVGLVERFGDGLQTVLGEGGALVSGGEGQRVRLGRALMRDDARLVILDEPFRGLDRGTRRRMLARALDRFDGSTVICVTHDVSDTRAFDRVIVVDGGRVVEDAPPSVLAADETSTYRRLLDTDEELRLRFWLGRGFSRMRLERGRVQPRSIESAPAHAQEEDAA